MSALFDRVVNLTIAPTTEGATGALAAIESTLGIELSNLDCAFVVKKNLKPEPNTAEIKVYNLSQSTRRTLENAKKLYVRLEAGYPGRVAQLFLGEVRSAHSHREGTDIITEISTGDGEKEIAASRINVTLGPKVPAATALTAIAQALNVGLGNVPVAATKLAATGQTFFGPGTAISGNAARMLTDFCRSADLEWSIQDGVLQILERGQALDEKVVELSPESGLLGSPTIDLKKIVTVNALIQPDLLPGKKISLVSESLRGGYLIQEVQYTGDTAGNDWNAKLSCKAF